MVLPLAEIGPFQPVRQARFLVLEHHLALRQGIDPVGDGERLDKAAYWDEPRTTKGKMVLPERIELSTSPLPRECSTTELRQRTVEFRLAFCR